MYERTRLSRAFEQGRVNIEQCMEILRAVNVLNNALACDSKAICDMMRQRVDVNDQLLVDHSTIQVGEDEFGAYLRPMGLINGLFGADEDQWGYIAMEVDEKDHDHILRFVLTDVQEWSDDK